MKLYISDKYRVSDYSLPSKVEDSFLINYVSTTGIEESITLVAENGKWTISSNYDMAITKGGLQITKEDINNNSFYQIKFSDMEEYINLYCFDVPMNFFSYSLDNKTSISLGRSNCDILYENTNIGTPHFEIVKTNGYWLLKDNGSDPLITYVNGKRYHQCVLNIGDVIFTNGLKIIWMDTFIKINNPNNAIKTVLKPNKSFNLLGEENRYTPVKETERGIVLFNENQLFFHTPRLSSEIKTKEITIANPPDSQKDDGPPAILTLGASIMMGISSSITGVISIFNAISGKGDILKTITEIIICFSMIIGSILLPILLDKYNKKRIKKKEELRQKKYSEYLNKKKTEIATEISNQSQILYNNNLSLEQIKTNITEKNNNIWNREISDSDFLTIRLGIGNKDADIKINAKIEEFSLDDDNLKDQVVEVVNSPLVMTQVPITVSLLKNKILPLIINNDYKQKCQLLDSIMLQIISYYSGKDLKIIVFTDAYNKDNWEYIKYLPHCCSDDFSMHFFSTNDDDMKSISNYLEIEFDSRNSILKTKDDENNSFYTNYENYYLIITDNYIKAKRLGIIEKIVKTDNNLGFSLLMIEPTMQNIPSKASEFIEINNNVGIITGKDLNNKNKIEFIPEVLTNTSISDYANIIANIPILSKSNGSILPTSINFLEMYKVGKIEQLNIFNRWVKNNPILSLATPIGVNTEGKLFNLDLHEKAQGPHGLIAGATGSGKSEFIISFILSMAVNYHPYEVQFVLIDYKGGGLAGAFENRETGIKIPHLAGTITNLDTSEMNRALVSINSELKRRQKMFNIARDSLGESTVDIYKYQQLYRDGKVEEPISHLFIISDEFAELKSQQPDFMEQLVSTARIGRSLGVHLILATQKPSGVVDDQIWSNSRFKVCLKVQTAEDSQELLKRPEAASIKETGRFYLQVGYNESFELGQSGWAGAKYNPTDRILKNIDDSIDFINNTGTIIKSINDKTIEENTVDRGDQLTNIVKTLYDIAIRENLDFKSLWLPSIPKEIYLSNIIKKYNYSSTPYQIVPIIGEYDDPANQKQDIYTLNLTNTGNLLVFGNPGSGKENLLQTLIYSICLYHSVDEVNFYILDFGAEILKIFNNMPHVGDIALIDDDDKVLSLFTMIEREMNKRKELFSEYGGNYNDYIKNSGKKIPFIINVINGFEAFAENHPKSVSYFELLLRDCTKYGIVFIVTSITAGAVGSKAKELFNNKIATQLSDPFNYRYELDSPLGLVPANTFGRGVAKFEKTAYEFQTAYIYLKDKINDTIKDSINRYAQSKKAKKIPIVPEYVNFDSILPYIEEISNVPLGVNIYNANIEKYDFKKNKVTRILGNNVLSDLSFIKDLVKIMDTLPNIVFRIIDFASCLNASEMIEYYNGDFTDTIKSIKLYERENNNSCVVNLILGTSYIHDKVLDEGVEFFENIFNNINNYKNSSFVLADNYSSSKKIENEQWYKKAISTSNIIWIGNGIDTQKSFKVKNLSNNDINEEYRGKAFIIENGEYKIIKSIGTSEGGGYY